MEQGKKIPQIKVHLEPLSDGAIDAMFSLQRQRMERRVRKISKGNLTSEVETLALEHLALSAAEGITISDEELSKKMNCTNPLEFLPRTRKRIQDEVDDFKRILSEQLGFKNYLSGFFQNRDYILNRFVAGGTMGKKSPVRKIHENIFGSKRRIYFRLKDSSDSLVQDYIAQYLKETLGDDVVLSGDAYKQGLVLDKFRRQRKIGSFLESKISYEETLKQAFQEDPARAARDIDFCIARHKIRIDKIPHVELPNETVTLEDRLKESFARNPNLAVNGLACFLRKNNIEIHDLSYIKNLDKEKKARKESLRQVFQEDPVHAAQDLVVVLSRHPLDIARSSYRRGWESCQTEMFPAINDGSKNAKEGVIIAYLVKGDDPDIANPLARVMIKPYHLKKACGEEKGKTLPVVFRVFKPIGWYHPSFYKAIVDFVEERMNNKSILGHYKLPYTCEAHEEATSTIQFSSDPRTNLDMLGERYDVNQNGSLSIGSINLKGMGLNVLPDFSSVEVKHTFDCSDNNIYSLRGSPVNEIVDYHCRETMIVTFDGAPPVVRNLFQYIKTPYLSSLAGISSAPNYFYGNHDDMKENMRSSRPLVRALDKDLFPRFRR